MNIFEPLVCPHCGASLNNHMDATVCPGCNKELREKTQQPLNLPRPVATKMLLASAMFAIAIVCFLFLPFAQWMVDSFHLKQYPIGLELVFGTQVDVFSGFNSGNKLKWHAGHPLAIAFVVLTIITALLCVFRKPRLSPVAAILGLFDLFLVCFLEQTMKAGVVASVGVQEKGEFWIGFIIVSALLLLGMILSVAVFTSSRDGNKQPVCFGPIIRDVALIFGLTYIGAIVGERLTTLTAESGLKLLQLAVINILPAPLGFIISGCLAPCNRWRHLTFVAFGVWLMNLNGVLFRGSFHFDWWMVIFVSVAFWGVIGVAISYAFKRTGEILSRPVKIMGMSALIALGLYTGLLYYQTEPAERLRRAAFEGQADTMKLVLNKGADVNTKMADNWTALMWAANRGHLDVVKLLLDNRADINAKTENGSTALTLAALYGHTEVVKLLLGRGADINVKTRSGATALILAAAEGHEAVVRLLLDKGADVKAKTIHSDTALTLAKGEEIKMLLRDAERK